MSEWMIGTGSPQIPSAHVTELDLNRNGLAGRLPGSLGELVHMTELDLSRNGLAGRLPGSLGELVSHDRA